MLVSGWERVPATDQVDPFSKKEASSWTTTISLRSFIKRPATLVVQTTAQVKMQNLGPVTADFSVLFYPENPQSASTSQAVTPHIRIHAADPQAMNLLGLKKVSMEEFLVVNFSFQEKWSDVAKRVSRRLTKAGVPWMIVATIPEHNPLPDVNADVPLMYLPAFTSSMGVVFLSLIADFNSVDLTQYNSFNDRIPTQPYSMDYAASLAPKFGVKMDQSQPQASGSSEAFWESFKSRLPGIMEQRAHGQR